MFISTELISRQEQLSYSTPGYSAHSEAKEVTCFIIKVAGY
jgi:hypothetical protein